MTARWVPFVLIPIAVVLVAHLLVGSSTGEVARSVTVGAAWGGVLVAALLVMAVLVFAFTAVRGSAERRGSVEPAARPWLGVAVVAYFIMLTAISSRITPLPLFDALDRHWQGKVLDLLWVAILFGMLRPWARTEAGLRWDVRSGSMQPALVVVGLTFGVFVALTVASVALEPSTATSPGIEQILYNATIPNLTEELIWRGAMLAVLNHLWGTPRTLFGASVGWGLVVTSVLFGLGHGILLDLSGAWSVNVAGGLFATVMGLALGWIWARTGSIWPAFLLHCAPELGVDVGMLIM